MRNSSVDGCYIGVDGCYIGVDGWYIWVDGCYIGVNGCYIGVDGCYNARSPPHPLYVITVDALGTSVDYGDYRVYIQWYLSKRR